MHTIDQYIDRALEKTGLSDRQLGVFLGKSQGTVSQWRTKRAWPADATMIALAQAAEMDQEQAILDLNIWRSTGQARAIYQRIAAHLAAGAVALAVIVGHSAIKPTPAMAAGSVPSKAPSVYIMENISFRLGRLFRRIFRPKCCVSLMQPTV